MAVEIDGQECNDGNPENRPLPTMHLEIEEFLLVAFFGEQKRCERGDHGVFLSVRRQSDYLTAAVDSLWLAPRYGEAREGGEAEGTRPTSFMWS